MAEKVDGPDTSSIESISSLRSKFESLGKNNDVTTNMSPAPLRQASSAAASPLHGWQPKTLDSQRKHVHDMSVGATERPTSIAAPTLRKPRLDLPELIPAPMVHTSPARQSSPTVTVDSPRSPPTSLHATGLADFGAKASGTTSHADRQPPVVNRAAKPKFPVQSPDLGKKHSNLTAPVPSAELSDRSASPFSTPPSSGGDSSPSIRKDPMPQPPPRPRQRGDSNVQYRPRNDSDASWVQRIRGDSDASVMERARTGSNASFVEPSSLSEIWLPPPSHHSILIRRELPSNGTAVVPTKHWDHQNSKDLHEDRPRLPARPEPRMATEHGSSPRARPGRTSPFKNSALQTTKSEEPLGRTSNASSGAILRIPAIKADAKFALGQSFDGEVSGSQSTAPAVPPPRRSAETRREAPPPPSANLSSSFPRKSDYSKGEGDVLAQYSPSEDHEVARPSEYPDATRSNRRLPKFKQRPWVIPTEYDTRLVALCGEFCCTSGYITKAWSIRTGEQLLHMDHRENIRATSVVFKPSSIIEDEGKRVWLGTNAGEIHEVDIPSQSLVKTKSNAHDRREVIRMFRYASELWTMDDGGGLNVWKPDHKGMPSLDSRNITWRIPRGITFSLAAGRHLWIVTGKEIRVFLPGAQSDSEFQVLRSPLSQSGAGDVTCGTTLRGEQDLAYFGHSDGKVSIYSRKDFTCKGVVNVSVYRISSLAGVGESLWAGYSTGTAYVYDTSTQPWTVRKDWKAHEKQVCSINADPSSVWKMGRLNVVTLGLDNLLRVWDGMLEDDWLESRMHERSTEYCSFREITAAVLTWNAGASKPSDLQHSQGDSTFLRDYLTAREPPEIFVFGFQELVDLENKKATAKAFFKGKRKDPGEQEHMSHQYREWRDHLNRCINDHMPNDQGYTHLHTSSMVGLFTSVFVKSHLRQRIRHVHTSEVKRGMGGHHGNKGALILRMILDDSSICLVNCHLAAGQTHTMHRNNDIAAILDTSALPDNPMGGSENAQHMDVFSHGGDGSMITDHEICILNGDLNYRIDTMGRDAVVKHVQQGNLAKLLERDQLLLSRRKNPGFRLRGFHESPITFAPTYKYNVHSDEYDTSEKRRAPAWCDRILYRGLGAVVMHDYRRWDQVRVSDHRPVSGRLRLRVKVVHTDKREMVWSRCAQEIIGVRQRIAQSAQLQYLIDVLGMSQKEAIAALQGKQK